jgi:hypothetical protein
MLTKIMTTLAVALLATTTAQAATVGHKHQTRNALPSETAVVGPKARASMARMSATTSPTGHDLSHYQNGAQSAPAGH